MVRPSADAQSGPILSDADEDLGLVLKPVSIRRYDGPPSSAKSPLPAPLNPLAKQPVDVDAVIARLLGKPLPPEDD